MSDDELVSSSLRGWSLHFARGRGWRVLVGTMTVEHWQALRPVIADEFACHFVARSPWVGVPLWSVPARTLGDARVFCERSRVPDAVACIRSAVLLTQRTAFADRGSLFAGLSS